MAYAKKLSELTDEFDWGSTMGTTASKMRETNFETWGFLIYRCAYGDDAAWKRYMEHFKDEVHKSLEYYGREWLLEQYAQWTVVSDKENLDGASKSQVRERFVSWRDEHSVSYELPEVVNIVRSIVPTHNDASNRLPRFTYCLYVDQTCLDTLGPYLDAKEHNQATAGRWTPLVVVMIDGDYTPEGHAHPYRQFPAIEGCTDEYVGWQYLDAESAAIQYDELHHQRLDTGGNFSRPPGVFPVGLPLES